MLFHNFLTMDEVLMSVWRLSKKRFLVRREKHWMDKQNTRCLGQDRIRRRFERRVASSRPRHDAERPERSLRGSAVVVASLPYPDHIASHGTWAGMFMAHLTYYFFLHGSTAPSGPRPPHCRGFTIILRHTTLGRTPLDEWSARRRDLYLKTHDTHNRQTSMPPAGFELAISAGERPQAHALNRAATGNGTTPYTRAG